MDEFSYHDPNAPKEPKMAYLHFWGDKREEVIRMNPGIGFKDVAKTIGSIWGGMTNDEKHVRLFEWVYSPEK